MTKHLIPPWNSQNKNTIIFTSPLKKKNRRTVALLDLINWIVKLRWKFCCKEVTKALWPGRNNSEQSIGSTQDLSWKKNLSSTPRLQRYLPLLCEEHHWPPPRCVLPIPHIQPADSYFKALLLFLQTSLLSKFECLLICEIHCTEYPLKMALCPQVYDNV